MAVWRKRKPEGEGSAHLDEVAPDGLPDNEMYVKCQPVIQGKNNA